MVPHLTFSTPYSYSIFAFTVVSFVALLLALPFIPLRPVFLFLGLSPFVLTPPLTHTYVPGLLRPHLKRLKTRITRLVDDDRLEDRHWKSILREVELWENERLGASTGAPQVFSKANLKSGERKGWTRGRDGWSTNDSDGLGDVKSVFQSFESS